MALLFALRATLLLTLLLVGCGRTPWLILDSGIASSEDAQLSVHDADAPDIYLPRPDARPRWDGGVRDLGIDDTGVRRDIGSPDADPLDLGPLYDGGNDPVDGGPPPNCVRGAEGCFCRAGGQACDLGLDCFELTAPYADPQDRVYVCARPCQSDPDCNGSAYNHLCRSFHLGQKACVSSEQQEGLLTNQTRERRNRPLSGCEDGLLALPNFVGSQLRELDEWQASCGRPCNPHVSPGQPGSCSVSFPYCNPNVMPGQSPSGICALRRAEMGDICSRSSAVGYCDTSSLMLNVFCVAGPFDMVDIHDPTQAATGGFCIAVCDPAAQPDPCTAISDPGVGNAVCAQVRPNDPSFGVCDHQCSLFPDDCGRSATFHFGSSCSGDLHFDQNGEGVSFCLSVNPPVIAEYDYVTPPAVRCENVAGGQRRCAANTLCLDDGAGGICARTCDPAAVGVDGCAASVIPNAACRDDLFAGPSDGEGLCSP